ncbi:MAG: hypothetical protein K8I00_06630 [Candidatus Omnitrophica bacterium]|nr:hypothetical protein [Candidatus Omnitrophota bacterium]
MALSDILFNTYHGFYRPFAFGILRLAVSAFGPHPFPYHVLNFILFNVICQVVYRLMHSLTGKKDLAMLTAALYAVHPVHHPLVSNCFVLCLNVYILCGLLSITYFLKSVDDSRRRTLVISWLFFVAAVLSHLAAAMIPVYLWIVLAFRNKAAFRQLWTRTWPYFVALIGILIWRGFIPHSRSLTSLWNVDMAPGQYLATLWELLSWYHVKLLFPVNVIFLWDNMLAHRHILLKSLCLLIAGGGVLYLIFIRWRSQEQGRLLAWHGAGLLVILLVAFIYTPQTGTAVIEPLWFNLSSIGFFGLAGTGILMLKDKLPAKAWTGLLTGIFLALILLTSAANTHWRSERTYCRYWILQNPLNLVPWVRWATTYVQDGEEAILQLELRSFDRFLDDHSNVLAYANRGHVYNRLNLFEPAVADYSRALALDPDHVDTLLSRANCYAFTGKLVKALADLDHILKYNPQHSAAMEDRRMVADAIAQR